MNALEQLREKASKREAKLRRQTKEKEGEEKETWKMREENFRITGAISIELLTSRVPPMF
jgi:mRNA-degrading endonuclease RelE of RelBE toxin-antitoxin system